MSKDIEELLKTYDDLEEQYKLLMKQNKKLDNELTHKTKQYEFLRHRDNIDYYENIINKAIEYIENPRHEMSVKTYQELENILRGEDNE